jgi:anti-anti-sigma regulatory factor
MSSQRVRPILEYIGRLTRGDLVAPSLPSDSEASHSEDELSEIERALTNLSAAMASRELLYQAVQDAAVANAKRLDRLAEELSRANATNQKIIESLSSPIIQVDTGVILMPVFGAIDSHRGARMMGALLDAVSSRQSKYVIIDLTGAISADPVFCTEIVKLIRAIRLLGAQGIVVGIQAETAERIVATGLDLSHIRTLATLREALIHCRVV